MIKLTLLAAFAALTTLALATTASASHDSPTHAFARLINADGQSAGFVFFREDDDGDVHLIGLANGLTPGRHGMHIHAVGTCTPPDFTSAGGHFNPAGAQHGLDNPAGPHAGDLPNLEVGSIGLARIRTSSDRVSLSPGTTSLFDADGSALVVHAAEDDQVTNPTGNSGGRVLCGVIEPFPPKGGLDG